MMLSHIKKLGMKQVYLGIFEAAGRQRLTRKMEL